MKQVLLAMPLVLLPCVEGCVQHTAVDVQSRSLANLSPLAGCPNLSGQYAGAGRMVRGDPTQQIGTRLPINLIFPVDDIDAWKAMVGRYKTDDHHIVTPPDYATLTPSSENEYVVTTFYGDVKIGEYRTAFMKAQRVTCKSGVMHVASAPEETRSDYGPNHVTTDHTLQIDTNGDLIVRRNIKVEYHARLLPLPMGTGQFFEEYRFPRI
ncbi:hypothetical protein [Paraburkholderia caledonica]|uniref:hypothetical protein n=1 Tax=Paraburkholderia caledonica TaxID=134536 RepID=UPI000DEFA522|nr:hypothetical protein [Paraburkholderia caledonica]AXF18773.1 hypothetical protein CUJ87_30840 [Paraburkholderia caledonica]